MIIVFIWGLFLTLSFAVLNAFYSVSNSEYLEKDLYKKERSLIFLNSVLYKVVDLLNRDKNNYDAETELWAKPFEIETPLGKLEIKIVDLDRYINVNYVGKDPKVTKAFERLLELLDINPLLEERLEIWNGAKKAANWNLPYPPKGKPLDSLYEFNYFWNNTRDLYGNKNGVLQKPGLLELVTVYSNGKININTAPYWVLRSLDPEIDDVLARQIIEKRQQQPFKNLMDLLTVDGINMDLLYRISNLIVFKSRFWKISITLIQGGYSTTLVAIYDKNTKHFIIKKIN